MKTIVRSYFIGPIIIADKFLSQHDFFPRLKTIFTSYKLTTTISVRNEQSIFFYGQNGTGVMRAQRTTRTRFKSAESTTFYIRNTAGKISLLKNSVKTRCATLNGSKETPTETCFYNVGIRNYFLTVFLYALW